MKRLDRYVFKELSVPLLIGTIVFALLFVANDMIFIYKTFNVDSIPPTAIAQLLIYKFPQWLNYTLPIGASLGASLAVSRLARESEITAMRAAGISVFRVFRPMFFAGLVVAAANFLVVEKLVPPSSRAYKKLVNEVGLLAMVPDFKSNVMLKLDKFNASFGSIQKENSGRVLLRDVLLIERPRPDEILIYRAATGKYNAGVWTIDAPNVVRLKGDMVVTATSQKETVINEPVRVADLFAAPTPEEETTGTLAKAIDEAKQSKLPSTNIEIAYHQKFAVPVACLVFAFTGAVLAMRFSKAGPFIGVLVSLGLVWLYFNAFIISGDIFGKQAWVPPIVAAWLPNLVFGTFGLMFVRRLE